MLKRTHAELDRYADKKEIILDFYNTWKSAMETWNLTNIINAYP